MCSTIRLLYLCSRVDSTCFFTTVTGRVGNLGLATAFFNLKNAPIAKNLIELLRESGQEVPDFLYSAIEDLHEARDARRRGRRGGPAGGSGRPRFGARDYRHHEEHPDFSRQVHYTRRGSFEQRDTGESWRSGPSGAGGKADGWIAPRSRIDGSGGDFGGRGPAGTSSRRADAVPTDWWAVNADERN